MKQVLIVILGLICLTSIVFIMEYQVDKIVATGESIGLKGTDLAKFVSEQTELWRENAKMQREERQLERQREKEKDDREKEKEEHEHEHELKLKEQEMTREKEKEEYALRLKKEEQETKIRELEIAKDAELKEMESKERVVRLENEKAIELARQETEKERVKQELDTSHHVENGSQRDSATSHPKIKMPYFDDGKDDMDAYLRRFERVVEAQGWTPDKWATQLAVLLRGKALECYVRLSPDEAKDYKQVKAALLKRYELTEDGFRRKFRMSRIETGETHTQFLQRLKNYLTRWIQLSNTSETFDALQDLLLKEQILNSAEYSLALFLRERSPATAQDMAVLAEQYREARQSMPRYSTPSRGGGRTGSGPSRFGSDPRNTSDQRDQRGMGTSDRGRGRGESRDGKVYNPSGFSSYTPISERTCFICQRKGHIARDCKEQTHRKDIGTCTVHEKSKSDDKLYPKCITARYMDKDIRILRDTGCTTAVVKRSLLPEGTELRDHGTYKAIDGVVRTAPMGKVYLNTPYFVGEAEVMVFDTPLYDIVIGDLPGARERLNPDPDWTTVQITEIAAVETRAQKIRSQEATKPLKTPVIAGSDVDATVMKEEQQKDESLEKLRELAKDEIIKTTRNNTSQFIFQRGLLMRQFSSPTIENGKMFTQLVVPKKFREQVMKIGHESIMAGHLATKKTVDRIQRQFYWPGIQTEVHRFCQSCDVCQRTVHKGKVGKVPLGQMPLIDTPFDRVAVDLVGPLDPVTDRKNRYILTLVDYATRYPEAVPLKNIDTESVAEALVSIFSRVGVPREILTDMGTQFTSDLMKEVGRLLSMKQLTTTPYHPMCNGLVERFNGTLKSMLKKMCHERPRDWDRYVIPLLFAYREVPQESLGFSPFELLYGRTVRGPMNILRELWTQDIPDAEVKSTYQYVLDLKERLQDTCELAQNELRKASKRYKKYYNTKAKDRKFTVGDKVLLLLPTQANKLLMQWKGPFVVVAKQGVADYRIQIGDKVKTFHANLLRLYLDRTEKTDIPEVAAVVIEGEYEMMDIHTESYMEPPPLKQTETIADAHIEPTLLPEQSQTIHQVLTEFTDVMTDVPGRTNLEKVNLKLTTSEPVRSKVYPIPYQLRNTVKKEIDEMLKMDVIEPSESPYASPIVLIRKKDASHRFCTDLRQPNKVVVFDPEPIPNTEDLFSRLGHSKYYTKIDLSKGFWQIEMEEESKKVTAFVTPQGLFQWKVMPFGLVTAPAIFSRMMRKLLKDMESVVNYIDDILIYSETWEEHVKKVREVLQRLREAGLTARPSKCYFGYESLEFLGHVVGQGELKPEETKIDKILKVARPQNKKQLRSFLGLIGYYRKFIPNFSTIAAPLTDMTRKGTPNQLEWLPAQVQALESMQRLMGSAPILRLPDLEKPFIVRTDASDQGLGAVLLQEHDGETFPVLYLSRKLNQHEKVYATIEKECLAIVWAIDKLKQYLYGKEFQLETDHQPLTWMHQAKITNSRIMRWALLLQPFRFVLKSIPGGDNHGADLLSRCGGPQE